MCQDSHEEKAGAIAEVLDLTHDQHSPFKLEFDDAAWKNHVNSLKPLGERVISSHTYIYIYYITNFCCRSSDIGKHMLSAHTRTLCSILWPCNGRCYARQRFGARNESVCDR